MDEVRTRIGAQLLIGLTVVALGVLFTLDNLDLIRSGPILRWWPIVVVLIGVSKLVGYGSGRHVLAGGLITTAGLWLLLSSIDAVPWGFWDLWPLALVFVGGSLIAGSLRRPRVVGADGDPRDQANLFVMMGGVEHKMVSQQFRGGEATAVMGGVELDLRHAKAAGDTVVVQVLAWWGAVELFVPSDWKVTSEALHLMAAFEDNTKPQLPTTTHLIVRGLVVMGAVEVKN